METLRSDLELEKRHFAEELARKPAGIRSTPAIVGGARYTNEELKRQDETIKFLQDLCGCLVLDVKTEELPGERYSLIIRCLFAVNDIDGTSPSPPLPLFANLEVDSPDIPSDHLPSRRRRPARVHVRTATERTALAQRRVRGESGLVGDDLFVPVFSSAFGGQGAFEVASFGGRRGGARGGGRAGRGQRGYRC